MKRQKENTKPFSFTYTIYKGDELILTDTITSQLKDSLIKKIAARMSDNGGNPVELDIIEDLQEQLFNEIIDDYQNNITEDIDFDDIEVEIQTEMPQELIEECNQFIEGREVTVEYFLKGSSVSQRITFLAHQLSWKEMLHTANTLTDSTPAFDVLRERFPISYDNILSDVASHAGIKAKEDIILKDFPYQVLLAL